MYDLMGEPSAKRAEAQVHRRGHEDTRHRSLRLHSQRSEPLE
jgi:hypothetical protein